MAYAMLAFTLKSFEKSHNQVMQFAPAVPDRRNRRPLITTLGSTMDLRSAAWLGFLVSLILVLAFIIFVSRKTQALRSISPSTGCYCAVTVVFLGRSLAIAFQFACFAGTASVRIAGASGV